MSTRRFISAAGACTAVGADVWSSAAAVRAGIAGFAEHPYMVDQDGEAMIVAQASYIDSTYARAERMQWLAAHAAVSATASPHPPIKAAVIGLPPTSHDVWQALARSIRSATNASKAEVFTCGHSAALLALQRGIELIDSGEVEACLIGGVDSYLDPEVLEMLDATRQLHSSSNPWGFIPGEAAAFLVLTNESGARICPEGPLCEVLSVGTGREHNLIRTDSVCIGTGLSIAVHTAAASLSEGVRIDAVISDMNGEPFRAEEYGFTVARHAEILRETADVLTPADCWGDVGAASGPLFCVLAAVAARKGYAPGPVTLIWTSSDTGERAAAVLHAPVQAREV